jgi:hypothetical protein
MLSVYYILPFHSNSGYTNMPQCYVIQTLHVSLCYGICIQQHSDIQSM